MRDLNSAALASSQIGCLEGGEGVFRQTLEKSVDAIVRRFHGRAFHYVELGPEPAKTGFIIERLLSKGAEIKSYIGVDINPASADHMKDALSNLLPVGNIHQRIDSFARFRINDIREENTPALVTMLGFQEGNEDPEIMSQWMSDLTGSGDILLSEMQLNPDCHWEQIADFYQHPLMERFSEIAFERFFGNQKSESGLHFINVATLENEPVFAAVMSRRFMNGENRENIFITNYCLKYTCDQFRRYRENTGHFRIREEHGVGDGTIVFQLSEKH